MASTAGGEQYKYGSRESCRVMDETDYVWLGGQPFKFIAFS
jgi:hypothetical protein